MAFDYGGRAEILDAARALSGGGEDAFRALLYAPEMHDPDLVIRTSGEQRMSNYLLWQSAYAELVFRDELWPDFTREAFAAALDEFARAPAPVRGPLMAARRRAATRPVRRRSRARAAQRRGRPRRARILVAIPALVFAGVSWDSATGCSSPVCACSAPSACTSCSRCSPSPTRRGWRASSAWPGSARRRRGRAGGETVLLAFVMTVPLVVLCCAWVQARHSGAPGVSVTILGSGRGSASALAHAVMLRDLPHGD